MDTPAAPGPPTMQMHAGCATVHLNRPDHLNRLHMQDLRALLTHFEAVAADPAVQVVVVTGSGRVFCAGFHIGEFDSTDSTGEGPQLFERVVDALEALPMPTVCRLNGSVYGGATDLALACDFRIGVTDMELRMPAARLGLHYYPSGLRRYVSRLGLQAAKRLFLLAESVGVHELLRIGYLDDAVADAALDARVGVVVDALRAGAPLAVRGMKRSLNEIAQGRFDLAALREREATCAASEDLREGLAAFAQRRRAVFHGR